MIKDLLNRLCSPHAEIRRDAAYQLEDLVTKATAPGKEKSRKVLACQLQDSVDMLRDDTALCLVLEELRKLAVPGTETVAAHILAATSPDDAPFSYALNLLRTLKTEDSCHELENLITHSEGEKQIFLFLSLLEYSPLPPLLLKMAVKISNAGSNQSKLLACSLLAHGCWEVFPQIMDLLDTGKKSDFIPAVQALSSFFRETAVPLPIRQQFAQQVLEAHPMPFALDCMLAAFGECETTMELLCSAAKCGDAILRNAALNYFYSGFSNPVMTEKLISFTCSLQDPASKADAVRMLGCRKDPVAQTALQAFLHDPIPEVKIAALHAGTFLTYL